MTKEVNKFPVDSLVGTIRPDNKRNYYKWRNIPVSRNYHAPKAPYSKSFNSVNDAARVVKEVWGTLAGDDKRIWYEYADLYSRMFNQGSERYNGWTFFFTCNMYRYINTGTTHYYPPPILPPNKMTIWDVLGQESPTTPLYINCRVDGLPDTNHFVIIRLTNPFPGHIHALRKSELKYVHGFVPGDFFNVPIKTGGFQLALLPEQRYYPPGQYYWIEHRLLSGDYMPYPRFMYQAYGGSTMSLLSVGTISSQFYAAPSCGLLNPGTPGGPSWHQDDQGGSRLINTYSDDAKCQMAIPYAASTVIDKISVEWAGGNPFPKLNIKYIEKDYTVPELTETTLAEVEEVCPAERVTSVLIPSKKPLDEGKCYFLLFESNNPNYDAMYIHRIIIETSKRFY